MNKRSLLNEHVTNEKNKGGIKRCLVSNDDFNESMKISFEKKYHSESASGVFENPNEDVEDPNNTNTSFNIYYSKDSKKRKGRDSAPLSKKEKSEYLVHRRNSKDGGNVKDGKEKIRTKEKNDYKSNRAGEVRSEKKGHIKKVVVQNEENNDTKNSEIETNTSDNEESKLDHREKELDSEEMENGYDNRKKKNNNNNNMKKENESFYRTFDSNDVYGSNLSGTSSVDKYGKDTKHEKVKQKEEKNRGTREEKDKEKNNKIENTKRENTKRENEEKERDVIISKEKREEGEVNVEEEEDQEKQKREQEQEGKQDRKGERDRDRKDDDCDTYGVDDGKKRKRETEKNHNESSSQSDSEYSFLILKNMPVGVNEEDIKSFMRPFIHDKTPQMQFYNRDVIVKLYDNKLNEYIFSYFSEHPTQIKGSFVEVHLVNSKEETLQHEQYKFLVEPKRCSEKNENLLPLNSTDEAILGHYGKLSDDILELYGESNLGTDPTDKRHTSNSTTECSKVLLVSVINLHFPVDIELLYFLFSKLGVVEKIVNFNRNTIMYQALVQFNTVETATLIFKEFHNKNIYDGCNTILLQYSLLKELVIKANNNTSWDYTVAAVNTSKTMLRPIQQPMHGFLPDPRGKSSAVEVFQMIERKFKISDFDTRNPTKTPVLICYNLPMDYTNVDKIFNLFSVYGYVDRIKFLREKPDSALVQYSCSLYATLAHECLRHLTISNCKVEVHFSKMRDIRISFKNKRTDNCKSKMFSIYEQRYSLNDQMKYVKSSCRPTKGLFVSNLHDTVTEEALQNLFSSYGGIVKLRLNTLKEGKRSLVAVMEMLSEDVATRALMDFHNYRFMDRFIKISFTNSKLL